MAAPRAPVDGVWREQLRRSSAFFWALGRVEVGEDRAGEVWEAGARAGEVGKVVVERA
jgi:hypothetical protein